MIAQVTKSGPLMGETIMNRGIIIAAAIAGVAATLIGGAALLHGARAAAGWHDGPFMQMGMDGGPGFERGPRGMALLEQFDRSGDGQISQEDVVAVRGERFAAFDTDGDGVLALEEYERLWLDTMRPRMVRSFQRLDLDGDATVTTEEFQAPFDGMVARLDRDGDGLITEVEVRDTMRARHEGLRGGRDDRRPPRTAAPLQQAD